MNLRRAWIILISVYFYYSNKNKFLQQIIPIFYNFPYLAAKPKEKELR